MYVAFVIDAFARRIIGWRCGSSMSTQLVLDALEQAVWTREREGRSLDSVVAHTDRGSQYTAIRYTERLAEANIAASVGSVGSSYDNALAESINGLYKTELIKPRGPWRTLDTVEYATAEWVDWFNHRRLYEYCGDLPPADLETAYYAQNRAQQELELSNHVSLPTHRGGSTTIRLLLGLLRPTEGSATVCGHVSRWTTRVRRRART